MIKWTIETQEKHVKRKTKYLNKQTVHHMLYSLLNKKLNFVTCNIMNTVLNLQDNKIYKTFTYLKKINC